MWHGQGGGFARSSRGDGGRDKGIEGLVGRRCLQKKHEEPGKRVSAACILWVGQMAWCTRGWVKNYLTWRNGSFPAQPGLIRPSFHLSVIYKKGYRLKECLPEGTVVFYQCSLKEHYNYLLIPTCTESSGFFLRNNQSYNKIHLLCIG